MYTTSTSVPQPTGSYTIINHTARLHLHLSITEYCVFDLIAHLATNPKNNRGWCYASKDTMASYLSIDRATVFRIITTGVDRGLLEKHPEQPGMLRTTSLWAETMGITRWITQDTRRKMRRKIVAKCDAIIIMIIIYITIPSKKILKKKNLLPG